MGNAEEKFRLPLAMQHPNHPHTARLAHRELLLPACLPTNTYQPQLLQCLVQRVKLWRVEGEDVPTTQCNSGNWRGYVISGTTKPACTLQSAKTGRKYFCLNLADGQYNKTNRRDIITGQQNTAQGSGFTVPYASRVITMEGFRYISMKKKKKKTLVVSNTRREEEVDLWATLYLVLYYIHTISIYSCSPFRLGPCLQLFPSFECVLRNRVTMMIMLLPRYAG